MVRSVTGRLAPDTNRKVRWATAALFAVVFALTVSLFFLPKPLNIIPSISAVQPLRNPVESVPLALSPVMAGPDKKAKQLLTRPEKIPTASAQSVSEKGTTTPTMPSHLGSMKIREGGTVLQLLLQIYGNTETNRFKAVARANPHIKDMNKVRAGETITFPAIPAKAGTLETANHWVQIAKRGSLEEAYQVFHRYPEDQPPIRVIPSWGKKDGLVFSIILRKGFDDEQGAQDAIHNLPAELAAGAEIMKKPEKGTVCFAY